MENSQKTRREKLAEVLINIDNEEIIKVISEKSEKLLEVELERHRRIVDKGREYLRMLLILFGIVFAIGNIIFGTLNFSIRCFFAFETGVIIFYIVTIILLFIVALSFFKISYTHDFLWADFEDITFVPDIIENQFHYYIISQITNTWNRIYDFDINNSILIRKLATSSKLLIYGVLSFSISLILLFLKNILGGQ